MFLGIKNMMILGLLTLVGTMFLGCTMTAVGTKVPDLEFLTFGDFEDVEVDENGFPVGHRFLGGDNAPKGSVRIDDTVARSGSKSLLIEGIGSSSHGFGVALAMTSGLKAGKTYKASLWYRAPELLESSSSGEKMRFQLNLGGAAVREGWSWNDVAIESLSPGVNYSLLIDHSTDRQLSAIPLPGIAAQDPNDPSDWSELAMTFTLPDDFEGIDLIINIYNKTSDPLWIDDLSLKEIR